MNQTLSADAALAPSLLTVEAHQTGQCTMDTDRAVWKHIRGKVKKQYRRLTDDDLQQLEGHGEGLVGKLQERYGLAKEEAERQAKEFRSHNNWH